jgi:hypothetical protein
MECGDYLHSQCAKCWMVTNLKLIFLCSDIVFYFARNIHAHAYDALKNITF